MPNSFILQHLCSTLLPSRLPNYPTPHAVIRPDNSLANHGPFDAILQCKGLCRVSLFLFFLFLHLILFHLSLILFICLLFFLYSLSFSYSFSSLLLWIGRESADEATANKKACARRMCIATLIDIFRSSIICHQPDNNSVLRCCCCCCRPFSVRDRLNRSIH